tara:strand:+ start:576 stop:776 length:201 start_codon:yes stop_codon:yes gene_type:complete
VTLPTKCDWCRHEFIFTLGDDYLLPDIEGEFGGRRSTIETDRIHAKGINYKADTPTNIREVGSHLG